MVNQGYTNERIAHWDGVSEFAHKHINTGRGYHNRLNAYYKSLVPAGMKVLELGCGKGDLLASLEPSYGVGVDFSPAMLKDARARYSDLTFIEADVHEVELDTTFDYIILSDLLNDLWDVQKVLTHIKKFTTPQTKLIFNFFSRVWELPLRAARKLKLASPLLRQNWFSTIDVMDILHLTDYEVINSGSEVLFPLQLPLLSTFFNKFIAKLWPFNLLNFTAVIIARPKPQQALPQAKVSVVVAARNEEGHIEDIVRRTPQMGRETELIFVEGGSSDNTWAAIQKAIADNPQRNIIAMQQDGKGKGDAVRKGFSHATGDVLMILDADMTVLPEDLPKFYEAWQTGKAEFVNGVRLVYPMQKEAMRFCNLLGNKFFSLAFSWVLEQPVKDTLCGTKVIGKKDYEILAANRAYFGEFDPFGDFDLIFGAAKMNLRIVDLPIRYHAREYGETNISRWSHGAMLFRMLFFASRKLKFK